MVKASLEKPDLDLVPLIELQTGEGVDPTTLQMATQLEPELSALGELLTGRHRENRKAADLRSRRRQALEAFDRDVRAIVRTTQGLFRLAGRDDLAERFRPLLRRVLRRIDKAREDEALADQADGEKAEPSASDQAATQATEQAESAETRTA